MGMRQAGIIIPVEQGMVSCVGVCDEGFFDVTAIDRNGF